jgi:hypothetical protein
MRARCLLFMCAVMARGGDEARRKPELPASVRPVVELARSAPPEIFANAIVRLVEAGRIPQRDAQIDLLEEAFAVAAGAKEPYRLSAIPATPPDTRAIYRAKAAELRLDALSLRSRILAALLTVNPPRARELFDHITRPSLEPRACEDPLIADVSAYYEIAGALAQSAFTAAEKLQEAHVQFLAALVAGAKSPSEMAAFARAIQSVSLKPAEMELLLSALGTRLESVTTDYRPFALSLDALQGELRGLVELAQSRHIGVEGLLRAFRTYLNAQVRAARCSPDITLAEIDWFHGALPVLSDDELRLIPRQGGIQADPYFQSGDARQLGDGMNRLTALQDRASSEWRNRLDDLLRDFSSFQPQGGDADIFHQRATVFRALLQVTPPGDDQDRIVNLCAAFLRNSGAQRDVPAEFWWQVKTLVEAARAGKAKMLGAFRASGDPSLVLFAVIQ